MSTTIDDVAILTALALRIRQETYGAGPWDQHGTYTVFAEDLVGTNLLYATELVARHAADPDARTPAAIRRPFLPEIDRSASKPATAKCQEHPDEPPPPFCRVHATEGRELEPDEAVPYQGEPSSHGSAYEAFRAAREAVKGPR